MCTRSTKTRIIPKLPPIEINPVVRLNRRKRLGLAPKTLGAAARFSLAQEFWAHRSFRVAQRFSALHSVSGRLRALAPEGCRPNDGRTRSELVRSAQVNRSCQKKLCTTAASTA